MREALKSLLRSRKFLLAVFDLAQVLVFHFVVDFPPEVWQAIHTLVMVLIAAIAAEDFASKFNGNR